MSIVGVGVCVSVGVALGGGGGGRLLTVRGDGSGWSCAWMAERMASVCAWDTQTTPTSVYACQDADVNVCLPELAHTHTPSPSLPRLLSPLLSG